MTTVFADSFYFFALVNPRDPAHAKAVAFTRTFTGRIATTGWIITRSRPGARARSPRPWAGDRSVRCYPALFGE
jgi:hypothetical protein